MKLLERDEVQTLTSIERVKGLHRALLDVYENKIEGDFVECGTWMGGNIVIAKTFFDSVEDKSKKFYGFDTFTGMTPPTDKDPKKAHKTWNTKAKCEAKKNDVIDYMINEGIYDKQVLLIEGDVNKTLQLKENVPEKISILRLDTDFYDSTLIELNILYKKLVKGGWLIIDDYGHWEGCKRAVDEFFTSKFVEDNFEKLDYTGIMYKKI